MAIGRKILFASIAVTFAVAVGPILLSVAVSTKDKDPEVFKDCDRNGSAEGAPDVSRVVWTICNNNVR